MNLPLISVIVISYRRLGLLKQTVESFCRICTYPNLELILCDDGSPKETQAEMMKLPFDKFLFAKKNQGLGANTNKGIKAASGDYILQLQDDWLCIGPPDFLQTGINVMAKEPRVGMIRYYDVSYLKFFETHSIDNRIVKIFAQDQKGIPCGRHVYSDTPHLKKKEFHEKIGLYKEGVPMTIMELDFCDRFLAQDTFLAAYIEDCDLFKHIGQEHSFNPSQRKSLWKKRLETNIFTRLPFRLYLYLKHGNAGK